MKYISELQRIDKMEENPFFPFLKWKHPSIWQQFSYDRKLPFNDYVLYQLGLYMIGKGTGKNYLEIHTFFMMK